MTIAISSNFDSGAIEVLAVDGVARRPRDAQRSSRPTARRANSCSGSISASAAPRRSGARLRIVNAGATTYAAGWRDYRAVASWDRRRWQRLPTRFDGQVMTIELPPAPGPSYIAYFEPYSWERHLGLLAASCARGAALRRLGATVQGRDLDALVVGTGAHPVWIIGRQHPGETMAEWFIDGLLARLLDEADPVARMLRQHATFHVVPNMNPDGAVLGNLRTNAAGANLNREWLAPTIERSPEVKLVRDAMHATGCAAFFDIHGDEALPYVFVAGCEMLPNFSERQRDRAGGLQRRLSRREPGLPDRARLFGEQVQGGRPEARVQVRRPHVRLSVADARDAVQGQRQRAGRARGLERRPQPAPRRGDARSGAASPAAVMTIATGSRVSLRRARLADRPRVYEWLVHSDLTPNVFGPLFPEREVPTIEQFASRFVNACFDGTRPYSGRVFVIALGGEEIGSVAHGPIDLLNDVVELDIWLAEKRLTGRGVGSEALVLLADWLQANYGVNRFLVRPSRRNVRALRAMRRAGFRETDLPAPEVIATLHLPTGQYADEVLLFRILPVPRPPCSGIRGAPTCSSTASSPASRIRS